MPKCKSCHTQNNLGTKVCKSCGTAILIEEGYGCPKCSTVNGPFAKNCKNCGTDLKKKQSSNLSKRKVSKKPKRNQTKGFISILISFSKVAIISLAVLISLLVLIILLFE